MFAALLPSPVKAFFLGLTNSLLHICITIPFIGISVALLVGTASKNSQPQVTFVQVDVI